ncbi:hypothetical protein [Agrobacterium pusense]|uniref:hypothetical protein n=1 Tax=Agrobacterium pusense TaxID=648995 RepID=UPI002FDDCA87
MQSFLSFWNAIQPILAVLGLGGITIASLVGISLSLFKWLGEKWVDNRFEKELERYKSEHQQELERLKHKINSLLDRTVRLHTKEYEVLPELWAKLIDASMVAGHYLNHFQSYPDVGRMRDDELDDLLSRSPFTATQKQDVKDSGRRQDEYIRLVDFYKYRDAMTKLQEFNDHFRKNGIFVEPALKEQMDKLLKLTWHAVTEHNVNQIDKPMPRLKEERAKLDNEGKQLLEAIEAAVQDRLWNSTRAEL